MPHTKLVLMLLVTSLAIPAASGKEACATDLAPITARGRMLAAYDLAAKHAYEAVHAMNPPQGSSSRSIARNTDSGWVVAFGGFNSSRDHFLVVYQATQQAAPADFVVKKNDPPLEDNGFYLFAARAMDTAQAAFNAGDRPYNVFVLPADLGNMYVYIEPAQTRKDVIPLGGDVRYLISADGLMIIETRQMHKTIIEKDPSSPPGTKLAGGFHTHVLTDTPEDSDVFYVLRQHPPLPEFVGTANRCTYKIDVDGSITRAK